MPERRLDDDLEWEVARRFGDRHSLRSRRDPLTEKIRAIQRERKTPPHGTYARYQRGCKCRPCKDANNQYERERKARKMRQTWDDTWARLALVMAQRSRCDKAKIGVVIVSPAQRVVATGYNGPPNDWQPRGTTVTDHCSEFCLVGMDKVPRGSYDMCPMAHAEINALMHSDRRDREDGTIYVTGSVCMTCAKAVGNSGVKEVVLVNVDEEADAHRNPQQVRWFLEDCGVEVRNVVVDD